jgi:hypothetical protein
MSVSNVSFNKPSVSQPAKSFQEQEQQRLQSEINSYRQQFQAEMSRVEAEERAKFEADLAAKKAEYYQKYRTQIEQANAPDVLVQSTPYKIDPYSPVESSYDFEKEWGKVESQARSEFKSKVVAKQSAAKKQMEQQVSYLERVFLSNAQNVRTQFETDLAMQAASFVKGVKATKAKTKREYAMKTGKQWTPRMMSAWESGQLASLGSQMALERSNFETQFALNKDAFAASVQEHRELFAEESELWKSGELERFEQSLATEKSKKKTAYTKSLLAAEAENLKAYELYVEQVKAAHDSSYNQALAAGKAEANLALSNWQKENLAVLDQTVTNWEKEARASFESHILSWKTESWGKFATETIPEIKENFRVSPMSSYVEKFGDGTILEGVGDFAGGVFASFESWINPLMQIGKDALFPDVKWKAPSTQPTVFGAFISSGMESVGVRQKKDGTGFYLDSPALRVSDEWKGMEKKSLAFNIGTVGGDLLQSYLLGKGVEKILPTGVKTKIANFESKTIGRLTKPVTSYVDDLWKGSKPEMFLIKHSTGYAKKQAATLAPTMAFLPDEQVVSMSALKASDFAWSSMGDLSRGIKFGRAAVVGVSSRADLTARMAVQPVLSSSFGLTSFSAMKGIQGYVAPSGYDLGLKDLAKNLASNTRGSATIQSLIAPQRLFQPAQLVPKMSLGLTTKAAQSTLSSTLFGVAGLGGLKLLTSSASKNIMKAAVSSKPKVRQPQSPDLIITPLVDLGLKNPTIQLPSYHLESGQEQDQPVIQVPALVNPQIIKPLTVTTQRNDVPNIAPPDLTIPPLIRPRKQQNFRTGGKAADSMKSLIWGKKKYNYPFRESSDMAKKLGLLDIDLGLKKRKKRKVKLGLLDIDLGLKKRKKRKVKRKKKNKKKRRGKKTR